VKRIKIDFRGSTLVFLLFTISVIVLIGSVVLSLSVMNYKMKKINSQVKRAFYLSESGIDEAYMMTKQYVNESVNYAIKKYKDFNEVEIKNYDICSDEVFQSAFKNYIKGTCKYETSCKGLENLLNDNTSYLIFEDGYPKISASLVEGSKDFSIEVKSTYIYQNIKKEIVMKLKIDIPEYDTEIINSGIDADDLVHVIDWKIERGA